MVFGLINAIRVKIHYDYLIVQQLIPTEHRITNIACLPLDETVLETFWAHLIRHNDPLTTYSVAKIFNHIVTRNVQLIVYENDQGNWYWQELDDYLFKNQFERFYLDPDFRILEYEQK
jgi:hypothetical protein